MKKLLNIKGLTGFIMLVAGITMLQSCSVYNPDRFQQVTVPDIVQMSKEGLSSKEIISEIRHSHSVYSLKADQLANLRNDGVQDSVLNYMEKTHIEAIRRNQLMTDYYFGWPGGYGSFGGFGFGWPYGYYGWGWGPSIIFSARRGFGGHYYGGYQGGGGRGAMRR